MDQFYIFYNTQEAQFKSNTMLLYQSEQDKILNTFLTTI